MFSLRRLRIDHDAARHAHDDDAHDLDTPFTPSFTPLRERLERAYQRGYDDGYRAGQAAGTLRGWALWGK